MSKRRRSICAGKTQKPSIELSRRISFVSTFPSDPKCLALNPFGKLCQFTQTTI
ncbi:hypothetical protein GHT06_010427 [Daphnia sinensis]|uniref:Uncharacterized protein n=1 Tax=Daphnia sinensis TaxID=1820382 RepID=A0AAD5KYE5_9CRUS|nr:hypothetical protein GHT06_010427 [Daphnia sinensis]